MANRCRYRAFLRICFARGKTPQEVIQEAGVGGAHPLKVLSKMKQGQNIVLETYQRIAGVLNCEPTNLFYTSNDDTPQSDTPALAFAKRVVELLDEHEATIPKIDPDTNEETDIVEFIWQLGDPKIDTMRMTYEEQREGFFLVRDLYLRVFEESIESKSPYQKQIGKMRVGPMDPEDIIDDIMARKENSHRVFEDLREQYRRKNMFHIMRIREGFPHRYENYCDAFAADKQNIAPNPKTGKNEYLVNERLVNNVIDADFDFRKLMFPTYQQDETFRQCYSRSRRLIEHKMELHRSTFPKWWPNFRDKNTEDIDAIYAAWKIDQPKEEPDWDSLQKALEFTLERTCKEVRKVYLALTGSRRNPG